MNKFFSDKFQETNKIKNDILVKYRNAEFLTY